MESSPPPLPPPVVVPPVKPRLGRTGLIVALLVIAGSLADVVRLNGAHTRSALGPSVHPSMVMNMTARYFMGLHELMKQTTTHGPTADLAKDLSRTAKTPVDQLRNEIVRGALLDRCADATMLAEVAKTAPYLQGDVTAALHANELSPDEWRTFEKRHGWIARLARAQASHWQSEDWPVMRGEAQRTFVIWLTAGLLVIVAFFAGIVLLVVIVRRWGKGLLTVRLTRPETPWASCFIEAFAIYVSAFAIAGLLWSRWLAWAPRTAAYALVLPFVTVAIFWPRLRGMESESWRQSMGWGRGAGVWREIGYGVVGWIAGLPLLALGIGITKWIEHQTGLVATHPIVDELVQPGWGRWGEIALAVLWAPLTEEAMFRGALFPALARRLSWIPGAVLGAFVFAAVHPQGWAGAPAIMALALTMSALRSFRGALIAPMTAHALNNGLVCVILLAGS